MNNTTNLDRTLTHLTTLDLAPPAGRPGGGDSAPVRVRVGNLGADTYRITIGNVCARENTPGGWADFVVLPDGTPAIFRVSDGLYRHLGALLDALSDEVAS